MTVGPGPSTRLPRNANRTAWNPAGIHLDGSMTLIPLRPGVTVGTVVIDPGTGEILGEITEVLPSRCRTARLRRQADERRARQAPARNAAGRRASRWAGVARAGLPVRVPPGLEHLGQPEWHLR